MADPKLVDLAYTKAELKEEKKEMAIGYDGQPNPYPWGLCLRLESKELDKLGITDMPQIGSEFHMLVVAEVTSVEQSARQGSDETRCVGLQITAAQILLRESADEEAKETGGVSSEAAETRSVMSKYR